MTARRLVSGCDLFHTGELRRIIPRLRPIVLGLLAIRASQVFTPSLAVQHGEVDSLGCELSVRRVLCRPEQNFRLRHTSAAGHSSLSGVKRTVYNELAHRLDRRD